MNPRMTPSTTLVDQLGEHAARQPGQTALECLRDDTSAPGTLTFAQLEVRAREIAAALQHTVAPGSRALLLFHRGDDYAVAFLGCLYAGVIAVPAYPPESTRAQHLERLRSITRDARPALVLTERALQAGIAPLRDVLPAAEAPRVVALEDLQDSASGMAGSWRRPDLRADSIAFLQYTSGSTGSPKGVQVSHGNLMANERVIGDAFGMRPGDKVISWLPLYHDMGLIGGLLQPVFNGLSVVLMSPRHFLERPVRWLDAIARHGGTVSGGPDFAYRLCLERVTDEQAAALDLRSWRVAFCGSEAVRFDTLKAFSDRFAPAGFDARALYPCYGLAEATLFATGGSRDAGMSARAFDAQALSARHTAEPRPDGVMLVGSGHVQAAHEVRIATADGAGTAPDGTVGEVWVNGPSVTLGYWQNAEATQAAFVEHDGRRWLRTGDLGFQHDGELFITGRLKDMIIVRGQNLYPHDLERAVEEQVEFVRKSRVAAFAVDVDGREAIGIAAEIGRGIQKDAPPEADGRAITEAVALACNEAPRVILLLNPGALPKTSSGKLQRSACRTQWEAGTLDVFAVLRDGRVDTDASPATSAPAGDEVSAIWSEVLGRQGVRPEDSFFALGGSSLAAARIVSRIQERLGVAVSLVDLFETTDLRAFRERVEQAGKAAGDVAAALPLAPRDGPLPLSSNQQRMWFQWRLEPGSAAYHIAGAVRLRGALDTGALHHALQATVARHETLRTRFSERDGVVHQRFDEPRAIAIEQDDLSAVDSASREAALEALTRREASAPFDLLAAPPHRVRLVRLAGDDHALLLTVHHIAADGWSMNVLLDEIAAAYGTHRRGEAPSPPAPDRQYADYAAWESAWAASPEGLAALDRQLAYWRDRLADSPAVLELPSSRPRPAVRSHQGADLRFALGRDRSDRIQALARDRRSTPFLVLLSAFQLLLARHGGQSDVNVGMPAANRRRRDVEPMVGCFVNTLVLRGRVDPSRTFAAHLAQARTAMLEAQQHQDLPFERLVDVLQPRRDAAHHPLFQVMVNHQRRDGTAASRASGLEVVPMDVSTGTTRFDLGLNTVEDDTGALAATFTWATDLMAQADVERLRDHWLRLLDRLCEHPDHPVGNVDGLSDAERHTLAAWSGTRVTAAAGPWVHEAIGARAAQAPEQVALVDDHGRTLTRGALEEQAGRLAALLNARGVAADARVGVAMDRCLASVAAQLAVLKAGGAFVPLDPEHPADRLAYMVADSGVRWVLTQARHRAAFTAPGLDVIAVDELAVDQLPPPGPVRPVHGDQLAYLVYTSGSTGRPKGAGNTHAGLLDRLRWMQAEYGLGEDETLIHKTPAGFDVGLWEVFWPLMAGARLAVAPAGDHRDPQRLAALVRRHGVSTIHFVPSMLRAFLATPEARQATSLRRVFSGGEVLSPDLRDAVLAAFPAARVDNRYGPAEALINVTWWPCRGDGSDPVPIGRPIPNVVARILGPDLQSVPVGVPGELFVGGSGLARGYHGRPALTAERFIPDPQGTDGERLYATGDLARWRGDGAIEYLGRIDQQLKVHGVRIEPGEIEAALRAVTGVQDAVVVARPGPGGSNRLVGYAVATPEADLDAARETLALQLPSHLVPSALVRLDHLPRLPSGKIDRRALPEPAWAAHDHRPPRDAFEQQLAALWQEVLQCGPVGLGDHFFELGGHSLLAMQLVGRIRPAFGRQLPLKAVFDAPRFEALAGLLRDAPRSDPALEAPAIAPADRSGRLPLSYSQERMWFLWSLDPDSAVYNVGGLVHLAGPLDVPALEAALAALVQRHEALRTVFPSHDGVPHQLVTEGLDIRIRHVDLSAHAEGADTALQALAAAEAHVPFDLEAGPLMRLALARLQAGRHALAVTVHHIVAEGWTMDIFAREMTALYDAFATGRPSPLAPLAIQYPDFAAWHRAWLDGGEAARQLAHWRQHLGTDHPPLALPFDRPRTAAQDLGGDYHRFTLDAARSQRIRAGAARHGVTLFTAVSAALFVLLQRCSGQSDLRLGFPAASRVRPELEGLIGAFLNTLVLRCDLSPRWTAATLLQDVHRSSVEAQSHQDVPFHHVVDAVAPGRSSAFNPVFQVLCNVQRWVFQQTRQAAGLELTFVPNDPKTAMCDLMLDVSDVDDTLQCVFTYRTALFDRGTVARLAAQWTHLIDALLAEDAPTVGELPLMDDAERRHLLVEPNATDLALPLDGGYAAVFEAAVRRHAGRVAATHRGRSITWAALDDAANRIAGTLQRAGVRPDDVVAVFDERGLGLLEMVIGTLQAGAGFLALDPSHPPARLAGILRASGAVVVVCARRCLDRLDAARALLPPELRPLVVDPAGATLPWAGPAPVLGPDHLAYVIYTSGSTGVPKGVMVTQAGMLNNQLSKVPALGLGPADVIAQTASQSFDISVWQLLAGLLCGACVDIVPDEIAHDPDALLAHVARRGITVLESVPSLIAGLLAAGDVPLPSLRLMLPTGEALPPALAREWFVRHPGIPLVNAYGPAECSDDVSLHTLTEAPGPGCDRLPIGRPTANTKLYVLDNELRPVPSGVVGELHVAGVGVGRGYVGAPAATADRFGPDPFGGRPGSRLYRTGDLARWRTDGLIEYVGRADHQVKVRGFRIEPGEIEARLRAHPRVRDTVVVARDTAHGPQLVAYVVPHADGDDPAAELAPHLRATLPDYMVPSRIVALARLPLTANGKVDRAALPEPGWNGSAHVPPGSALEHTLADVWGDVLGRTGIGATDNFFALGGHSLLATRVVSRVRRTLGIDLPLRALFDAADLRAFAARVAGAPPAASGDFRLRASAAAGGRYPLSAAQYRMWFLWRLDPAGGAYNMAAAFALHGELDTGALQAAFDTIAARHATLRTTFAESGTEVLQHIHPAGPVAIGHVDLRGAADPEAAARTHAEADAVAPFDLQHGPLLRVTRLTLGDTRHVLLIAMHHIVADGWSVGLLLREFSHCHDAALSARDPALPPLRVQYADYADWHRGWIDGPEGARQLAYWQQRLGGPQPVLALPWDRPPAGTPSRHRGATVAAVLDAPLLEALGHLARAEGTTVFAVLLATFQALLHRSGGSRDIRIGVPVANRHRPDTEPLIGCFVNTLVLRSDVVSAMSARDLVRQVRTTLAEAQDHQDLPFEKLVESLDPHRSPDRHPLFQVMMNHDARPPMTLPELQGLEVRAFDRLRHSTQFDLVLNTEEDRHGALHCSFTYATDLFDAATVERLADHWRRFAAEVAARPDDRLGELALLSATERRDLLATWSGPRARFELAAGDSLHARIAAQAARDPEAIAVRCEASVLTYGELERRADGVARRLRAAGAGPDTLVGLLMPRSVDLVVGMLGILKAQAAYVPLDPAYPPDRLAYMVEDSGLPLLLTQRALHGVLPGTAARVLHIEDDTPAEAFTAGPGSPDQLAYCIYTSGSTGRPKGALLTHRNVLRLLDATAGTFGFGPQDVWTVFHSHAFDFSVWEIFGALTFGGQALVVPYETSRSPEAFHALVQQEGATVVNQTPSAFRQWMPVAAADPAGLPSLRHVVFGGEALEVAALRPWFDRFGDEAPALVNMYGITETTVHVSHRRLRRADLDARTGSPIGEAIADLGWYVLDDALNPVPVGVHGEVHVGGPGLARGYLRRPGLTAERFVPNPHARTPGERLYRTGDLARWRPDGTLEYAGRIDQQVKVRGFRIELGEIEAALLAQPGVAEAVAVVRPDPDGPRIVAYVTGTEAPGPLREGLRQTLPEHMVPSAVVAIERLPLTRNGKLDREALPAPVWESTGHVEPRTDLERQVAAIWREVLGVERVGATDDFFALGGHSLLATRIVSRVRETLKVELPLRQLFSQPTVEAVARHVAGASSAALDEARSARIDALLAGLETSEP